MSNTAAISMKCRIALVVAMVLWASAFVGIRAGLQSYSPGALALFRFAIASVCMYFIYMRMPNRNKIKFIDIFWLLVLGAIAISVYHVALNYGEISIPSGTASFIISQSPVITTLLAIIFLRERLTIYGMLGMAVSICGVMLIMLGGHANFNFQIENFYILIAALAGSLYSILQKPFLKKYHAIEVTAYIIWGATLSLLIYLPDLTRQISQATATATFATIYLGIFPAAIAYVAWSYALAEMPASRASNFMYFMPIISTLLGWAVLSEMPLWITLLGGMVALLGLWVVNQSYHWDLKISKAPVKSVIHQR
jgi:drug/metabolite transporter (DMT)-like permease